MITALTICHAIVSVLLILIVLIHFGKGAEAGLVMDTSSSSFLPQQGNFLNKVASVLAFLFLAISLTLAVMRGHENKSLFEKQPTAATSALPAAAANLPEAPKAVAPTAEAQKSETSAPEAKK